MLDSWAHRRGPMAGPDKMATASGRAQPPQDSYNGTPFNQTEVRFILLIALSYDRVRLPEVLIDLATQPTLLQQFWRGAVFFFSARFLCRVDTSFASPLRSRTHHPLVQPKMLLLLLEDSTCEPWEMLGGLLIILC